MHEDRRDLAAVVRQKLAAGTLPLEFPAKMWVGKGNGGRCDVCEEPIAPTEIEYEPDFANPTTRLKFHQACLKLWNQERAQ